MATSLETAGQNKPVLVIGASGLDVVGQLEDRLQDGTSNPARIRTSFGGVARNVAENLARLGQPVNLISAVGADQIGTDVLQHTTRSGVDTSAVIQTEHHPTGFYMAVLNTQGQLMFAVDDMRALSHITPEYLKEQDTLFKNASMLFVDANLTPQTLRTALSLARKAKIPVAADPTSSSLTEKFKSHLNRFHLMTPNSNEAGILSGIPFEASNKESAVEAARSLVNQGVQVVLISLAEFGVCYATSKTNGHIPAIRTRIKDPTGAGDALSAAVIFGLLNDINLDDSIRLGVSAASLTLRHRGSVYPDLTLEKLYDQLLV
ncbi:MAG: carbohydrate kinase family protein [Anaerolineales bacterium]|nr:carbohydrate kinase family protein [Anaerolineales bacterium]